MKQYIERYNAAAKVLNKRPVKRFASKVVAARRVAAIEAELPRSGPAQNRITFDHSGRKTKTPPRAGSRRAKLLAMLETAGKRGVSFAELDNWGGFKGRRSTRQAIYLLSKRNGYRITGDQDRVVLG